MHADRVGDHRAARNRPGAVALQENQAKIHVHEIDQCPGSLSVELRRSGPRLLQFDDPFAARD